MSVNLANRLRLLASDIDTWTRQGPGVGVTLPDGSVTSEAGRYVVVSDAVLCVLAETLRLIAHNLTDTAPPASDTVP